jgi:hypothetical protein
MTVTQVWRITWISSRNEKIMDDVGARGVSDAIRIFKDYRGSQGSVADITEVKKMGTVILEEKP